MVSPPVATSDSDCQPAPYINLQALPHGSLKLLYMQNIYLRQWDIENLLLKMAIFSDVVRIIFKVKCNLLNFELS